MRLAGARAGAAQAHAGTRRIAAGIAFSLAVHMLVLNMHRGESQRGPAEPPRAIAVRLRPPPAPQADPVPTPPAPAARPARRAPRKAPPVIAVDPAPAPAQPDPFTVQQEAEPAPAAPRFDMDTARRTARSLAHIRDPAKEGTALAQFPEPPLETETRAARAIGAAKRRNCKDGIPGGLLGPLLLLADKKDSGCKW